MSDQGSSHPASPYIQDRIPDNHCFGCGPLNPDGLQIKSVLDGDVSICDYTPLPHHMAGPEHILNGGIIATLIDCHTVLTAAADAYLREGRGIGEGEGIWYATGKLEVRYLKPTPLVVPVRLEARIVERGERKSVLSCVFSCEGEVTAEGAVVAVRVPEGWRHGRKKG